MHGVDRNFECGSEAKVQWDVVCMVRRDIERIGIEEGLERPCSGMPSKTFRQQEGASKVTEQTISARMVDEIPFVVFKTRPAWCSGIAFLLAPLAILACPNNAHQSSMSTLLSGETLLASSWGAALVALSAGWSQSVGVRIHLIIDPAEIGGW